MRRTGRTWLHLEQPALYVLRAGLLLFCLPVALASCRLDDLVTSPRDPVVELELPRTIVGVADSVLLTAVVRVDGEVQDGVPLSWRTSNSDIATVSPQGRVQGHARGKVVVTAKVEGGAASSTAAEASDTVWVVAASLALSPAETTLTSAGDTLCLEYEARDASGATLAIGTPSFAVMHDPDSTVTLTQPGGCVVGRGSGREATVQATLDTATATAEVTVRQTITSLEIEPDSTELLSLGATTQLVAQATDRRGNPVPATLMAWTSTDTNVVAVDSVGEVTARGAGQALVRGSSDGLTDSTVVSVTPPDLSVTPSTVGASAKVGSTALQTADLSIDNAGTGSPNWSGSKSSSWLSLSKTSGGMPDNVELTFDPAGLAVGTYYDTVVVTVPGAAGSPAEIPVTFELTPCSETSIAPDAILAGVLTTGDCGAPHRTGGLARIYTIAGALGDTVSLRLEGDFDAYLFVVDATGTVLAENDECAGNLSRGPACIEEFALPGSGTYGVEATSFTAAATGNFTLRAIAPTAPNAPQGLGQFRSDGTTPIAVGGVTSQTTVVFEGAVTDNDPGDSLWLQIEVQPLGGAFTGTPTATSAVTTSGNSVTVTVSGLADNTSYHWQARAVDQTGRPGAWVSHGGNGEGDADLHVDTAPESPVTPANAGQFKVSGTPIDTSGTTDEATVVFKALLTDPDPGDSLRLEVEVQPVGTAFTNSPTAIGASFARGAVGQVAVPGLSDSTDYHWQVRARDRTGRYSLWISFGGNLENAVDFRVEIP